MSASSTPFLDALEESMHAHRKKTLFFLSRLADLCRARDVEPSGISVLELGCGNGRVVSLPIAERGFRYLGADLHAPSIAAAIAANTLPNATFVAQRGEEFSVDERFDAVILSDVLEHVDDPAALLATARAHLVDDGMLLLSVPNGHGPYELEQRLARTPAGRALVRASRGALVAGARLKRRARGLTWPPGAAAADRPAYNDESGHVQFFRLGDLEQLFAEAGFRIVERRNGAFVGGDITYALFEAVPALVPLSLRVVDRLPSRLAGTWYFDCRPTGVTPSPRR